MNESWETALNAGDVDGLTALYAEDCVLMSPNTEMMSGHAAARAEFGDLVDAGLTADMNTIKTVAGGDVGFHVGTYAMIAPDGTVIDQGKFIEGWQKVGGQWKIAYDIWNSDWAPGANTTTALIALEVKDFDHWIAAFRGEDSRPELFARNGAASTRMFQSADDPNLVALLLELNDAEAFTAFAGGEESTQAKAEDGVINSSLHMFTEVN